MKVWRESVIVFMAWALNSLNKLDRFPLHPKGQNSLYPALKFSTNHFWKGPHLRVATDHFRIHRASQFEVTESLSNHRGGRTWPESGIFYLCLCAWLLVTESSVQPQVSNFSLLCLTFLLVKTREGKRFKRSHPLLKLILIKVFKTSCVESEPFHLVYPTR